MKTLGMFITMSFLINEASQAKELQDLTLANDTIAESIKQAEGLKQASSADTVYRKKVVETVKAKMAQSASLRINPSVKNSKLFIRFPSKLSGYAGPLG